MNNKSLTELSEEIKDRFTTHRYWITYLATQSLFDVRSASLDDIHEAKTKSVLYFIRVLQKDVEISRLFTLTKVVFSKQIKLKNQSLLLDSIEQFEKRLGIEIPDAELSFINGVNF
jgi:hypothetical protein